MKTFFKYQLYLSSTIIFIILAYIAYIKFSLYKQEKYSKEITATYNLIKIYHSNNSIKIKATPSNQNTPSIIGTIEIPTLNISYPIFANFSDEQLKISPCRFFGGLPGQKGNLCIAGHNYNNNKFFSNISKLNIDDKVHIIDFNNKKFTYSVINKLEVVPTDLSPIYNYDKNSKQLTLITCNNSNKNRIIIQALLI